jgi:hypothetical protein
MTEGPLARLRVESYVPAPDEPVVRLSVASSLFPHLPQRSRAAFRAGLAVIFLLLVILGLLRWQAPMIAISALALPLVFLLYLYETDRQRVSTFCVLVPTALLGIGLGVCWALATGSLVSAFYDVSPADRESRRLAVLAGIGVPVGGAILMLVPVLVMRFARPTRDSLHGFVIGSLGAICFTAAATLVRLAPQFATGLVAGDRPASVLLVQAGVQGVAAPITAAALGGLVGAAMCFGGRSLVASSVLVTLALYAVLGVTEVVPALEGLHLGAHLMITVLALLALRIGFQYCLLNEGRDGRRGDAPVRHTTDGPLFTALAAGLVVAVAAGVTASVLVTPLRPRYTCPPDCGRPPIGQPIEANPRFVADGGEFSVQYPGPGSLYKATLYPDWVALEYAGGDTGTLDLWGEPAEKRTAKQVIDQMIAEYYPDATLHYEIPNAMVGYEPGYGGVFDQYPQDSSGTFTRLRLVALSAIKNDYALVALAVGPYHEFTPDFGTGHPSGANLALALDMGKYVNSFRWVAGPAA